MRDRKATVYFQVDYLRLIGLLSYFERIFIFKTFCIYNKPKLTYNKVLKLVSISTTVAKRWQHVLSRIYKIGIQIFKLLFQMFVTEVVNPTRSKICNDSYKLCKNFRKTIEQTFL